MKKRINYYNLFHVRSDAPIEIIRASYRALMRDLKTHPDLGGKEFDAALLNEAYETLSNSTKRAEYDKQNGIPPSFFESKVTADTHRASAVSALKHDLTGGYGGKVSVRDVPVHAGPAQIHQTFRLPCRECKTELIRVNRKWWMRLLFDTKLYLCPACSNTFLWLCGHLIKR